MTVKCCYRQAIEIDETIDGTIKNEFTASTNLIVGGASVVLYQRTRNYLYSYHHKINFPYTDCTEDHAADTSWTANISDTWNSVDTEVIYVDPRHDHIVYREHEVNISIDSNATTVNMMFFYGFFAKMPVTITKTTRIISSILGVVDEKTDVVNLKVDLAIGLGEGHLVDSAVPSGYYSYNLYCDELDYTNPERDGVYWTYPNYLHGQFFDSTHDYDYLQTLEAIRNTGDTTSDTIPWQLLGDDYPQGSWAFDADNNMFFSMMTDSGIYNKLVSSGGINGDPVLLTGLDKNNPVFYPIAPA